MPKRSPIGAMELWVIAAIMSGCSVRFDTGSYREEIPVAPTELALVVSAEGGLANRVNVVRVQVRDTTTDVPRNGRDIRAVMDPVRLTVTPIENSETYELTVRILDADNEALGTQTVVGEYVQNETREVWITFDEECALSDCPSGFRCQQGECVEHCVQAQALGTTMASAPSACGEPCEGDTCQPLEEGVGGNLLRCTNGYYTVEQQCGFGCDNSEEEPKCKGIIPHNVPEIPIVPGFADLVVGENGVDRVVLDTDDGTVEFRSGASVTEMAAEDLNIGFETVDVGLVEIPFFPPGDQFLDPADVPVAYGVFSLESLVVLGGATLSATGSRSLILLVNQDIVILGTISVAATKQSPGPGGFAGGCEEAEGGEGPSAGGPGTQAPGMGASGGGGGGYAWSGGYGGEGAAPGGSAGWPLAVTERPDEPPLFGGSGGGSGTETTGQVPCGGHGGGAIQISTNSRLRLGRLGVINAGGSGGSGARGAVLAGAGGGGAGGAVWIEAGQILWPATVDHVLIGAPGGGGGAVSLVIGEPEARGETGSDGHPSVVPARGGTSAYGGAGLFGGFGGDGSNSDGYAQNGQSAIPVGFLAGAGGGGGGAGHLRFYTAMGAEDRDALLEVITPTDVQVVVEEASTE